MIISKKTENIFINNRTLQPLLTVDDFKKDFLFGVSLTDSNGLEMDDDVFSRRLSQAIDYISSFLDCPIIPEEITEQVDLNYGDLLAFSYFTLERTPIIPNTLVKIKIKIFHDLPIFTIPQKWIVCDWENGQVRVKPTRDVGMTSTGAVYYNLFTNPGALTLYGVYSESNFPGFYEAEYKAGIANLKGEVPALVNRAIGLVAAVMTLQNLGDIGPGGDPGITSQSLAIDGMSQATSTAISATSNLYDATVGEYNKELKEISPILMKKYRKRVFCTVI